MPEHSQEQRESARHVIIGRNSKVWAALSAVADIRAADVIAIGHKELKDFSFRGNDVVWVFSYSKSPAENTQLLQMLREKGAAKVTYISSASTNVMSLTRCYAYPRVKQSAQQEAVRLCNARVVNIGWLYVDPAELPAGRTVATSASELASFMLRQAWSAEALPTNVFRLVDRPFAGTTERTLFSLYGALISASGSFPCLLRPFDVVLRALNMRWYGYLYLSNKLWSTTTS